MMIGRPFGWVIVLVSLAANGFLLARSRPSRQTPMVAGEQPRVASKETMSVALSPPKDLAGCQRRLASLEAVAARKSDELRRVLPLARLFRLGQPNPDGEALLEPMIRSLIVGDGGSGPNHTLECRDVVCKLTILEPIDADSNVWMHALQRPDSDLRGKTRGMSFHVGNPTQDPVTKEGLEESNVYFRLATPPDPGETHQGG